MPRGIPRIPVLDPADMDGTGVAGEMFLDATTGQLRVYLSADLAASANTNNAPVAAPGTDSAGDAPIGGVGNTNVPTTQVKGTTTVWDDLPPMPILVAKAGTAAPTLTTFVGNIKQYTFAVNDEVFGATELLHGYKEGTDIHAHVHWATNGSEGSDKAVKWELEYSICDADGSAPYASAFAAPGAALTVDETIPASTADRSHILSALGTITGTGIRIGAYIVYRFRRITSAGTAPAANPFALAIGFHAEQDTIGSAQIASKT